MIARTLALLLSLATLGTASASAQDVVFLAQQRYDAGLTAYEAGRVDEALEHFRASFGMVHSPNTRLMVARCLRNLERFAEALMEYELTAREAEDRARTEARFGATRDAALEEGAEVEPRVGRVRLSIAERPDGLVIRIGSREIPVEALEVAIPVDPGSVSVQASAPGHRAAERSIEVRAGATEQVELALEPEAIASTPEPSAAPPSSAPASSIAAWTSTGLFLAASGVAVALGVAAQSRYDGLASQCGGAPCPSDLAGAIAEGRSFEAGFYVGLAVAGAAAVAAIGSFVVWAGDGGGSDRAWREPGVVRW